MQHIQTSQVPAAAVATTRILAHPLETHAVHVLPHFRCCLCLLLNCSPTKQEQEQEQLCELFWVAAQAPWTAVLPPVTSAGALQLQSARWAHVLQLSNTSSYCSFSWHAKARTSCLRSSKQPHGMVATVVVTGAEPAHVYVYSVLPCPATSAGLVNMHTINGKPTTITCHCLLIVTSTNQIGTPFTAKRVQSRCCRGVVTECAQCSQPKVVEMFLFIQID